MKRHIKKRRVVLAALLLGAALLAAAVLFRQYSLPVYTLSSDEQTLTLRHARYTARTVFSPATGRRVGRGKVDGIPFDVLEVKGQKPEDVLAVSLETEMGVTTEYVRAGS